MLPAGLPRGRSVFAFIGRLLGEPLQEDFKKTQQENRGVEFLSQRREAAKIVN